MSYFTFSFLYQVFEVQCVFYTYILIRIATFQELNSRMWLMATLLDRAGVTLPDVLISLAWDLGMFQ